MEDKKIQLVASYTDTIPGRIIRLRAALQFWKKYSGADYSHISISTDAKLGEMMSFSRKEIKNPFNSGLVKEDIRKGMFALKPDISKIAVMELKVTSEQYDKISKAMNSYWDNKEQYSYNFLGLITMLLYARGTNRKNKFFCSQWVATILQECGIDIFNGKSPKNITPFDFYGALKNSIVYEGLATDYPKCNANKVEFDKTYYIEDNDINKSAQYYDEHQFTNDWRYLNARPQNA